MRLVLIVPDGVGVRNFILGKLLDNLQNEDQTFVFHAIPDQLLSGIKAKHNGTVSWHRLVNFRPDRWAELLQGSLGYAHMYWANTVAMNHTLSLPIRGKWGRRMLQRTKRTIGRTAAGPSRIRMLERCLHSAVQKAPETKLWRHQFEALTPDMVFCSQQLAGDAVPAVMAAKSLGIPTAAFIFSWDNLTCKGRIVAPFDHYLVWSNHMKREMLRYYPMIPSDRVHIVGTPQFEPYVDDNLIIPRSEFFRTLNADPGRPLICYSGGDAGTCPEDPEHVRVLMELIRSGCVRGNPQVLLRPVPVDDGRRYTGIREMYPELIYSHPKWIRADEGGWSRFFPLVEDIQLLANITYHADLNINLGSTMILDFGIHDKPVVNIAFDVADPPLFGMPVYDFYYNYEHLKPVLQCRATRIARSAEQLAEHVNAYLENPALDREGRRRLVDLQIDVPLSSSTRQLVQTLKAITSCRI